MTLKELDEIDCRIDDIKSVLLEKSEYLRGFSKYSKCFKGRFADCRCK